MKRSELVQEFAELHGLSPAAARIYIDAMLNSIAKALAREQSVTLDGFGVFGVRRRIARTITNPATGELMTISAALVPTFRSATRLRATVNGISESM